MFESSFKVFVRGLIPSPLEFCELLVKVIARNFIVFAVTMNSLLFWSCFLFGYFYYRKTCWFLDQVWAILLNLPINWSNLLILRFGELMITVMKMKTILSLPFQFLYLFFLFIFYALARASRAVLNNSGDSGHSLLIPDSSSDGLKVFHYKIC